MTASVIVPLANIARFKIAQAGHPTLHKNIAWFATADHRLLGTVVRDRYDNDFGWVAMRKDHAGRYRAFDLEVSHQTAALAVDRLKAALQRWAALPDDQLPEP